MPADPSQDTPEFRLPPSGTTQVPGERSIPLPGADSPLAAFAGVLGNEAPTSAQEWKSNKNRGFTVELPSGHKALVRRTFDLLGKLERGEIPNPLAGLVSKMIQNNEQVIDPAEAGEEAILQMISMFDETIEAMMIAPKFQRRPENASYTWEPDPDAIGPEDMSLEDKVFLYNVSQGAPADLATFRRQSADIVASISRGAGVQLPTESAD